MNSFIFNFLHQFSGQTTILDLFIQFIAVYLPWCLYLLLVWPFLQAVERRRPLKPFLAMILALIISSTLTFIIKQYYYVARPFVASTDIVTLLPRVADSSFPSAHATVFAALALVIWFYKPSWGPGYLLGAVLIGLSRIVIGWHWPLDVLVGWLLGLIIGACLIRLFGYNRRDVAA